MPTHHTGALPRPQIPRGGANVRQVQKGRLMMRGSQRWPVPAFGLLTAKFVRIGRILCIGVSLGVEYTFRRKPEFGSEPTFGEAGRPLQQRGDE